VDSGYIHDIFSLEREMQSRHVLLPHGAYNDCGPGRISATVEMVVWAVTGRCIRTDCARGWATGSATTPTLVWEEAGDADDYEIWICGDSECAGVVRNVIGAETRGR